MKSVSAFFVMVASMIGMSASASATRPLVTVMDATQISSTCDAALARASETVKKLQAKKGDNGFLKSWNDLQIDLENTGNPLGLMANVHPDKAARDASDACVLKLTSFGTDLFQNEKLYKRVTAVVPKNAIDAKFKKDLIEGFEDTGVTLPIEKRARAKAIFEKLEESRQAFDRTVRDDKTRVTFLAEELKGLPANYLSSRKLDEKGGLSLTLEYPDYNPFMQNATSEAARERYFRAFLSRGGAPNLSLLDEISGLRRELAGLYGFASYADYSLRRKMVENTLTVTRFLAEVKAAVTEAEKREIAELTELKARETGKPLVETKLNKWDLAFYQEKISRTPSRSRVKRSRPAPARRWYCISSRIDQPRIRAQRDRVHSRGGNPRLDIARARQFGNRQHMIREGDLHLLHADDLCVQPAGLGHRRDAILHRVVNGGRIEDGRHAALLRGTKSIERGNLAGHHRRGTGAPELPRHLPVEGAAGEEVDRLLCAGR